MKTEEKILFETFIATHPDFLDIETWTPGPEPPDVFAADSRSRKIGIELTEWLDKNQTTPSITNRDNQMKWLIALNSENHAAPRNFQLAQVWFRGELRFVRREEGTFRDELYRLMAYVDLNWERERVGTQKIWNDFSEYPTLGKHVFLIRFDNRAPAKSVKWVLGHAEGGAYDPHVATDALLQRIEEKKNKPNYTKLKSEHGLTELVLLLHYGIRGLLHNWPFHGVNWELEDTVREARENLASNPGAFDRVFLYLAYNEGQLFTLYP